MLTFVSTNADKIKMASDGLGRHQIPFTTSDLEVIEIQSESTAEIVRHKARLAFQALNTPVIVSDHGWAFLGLGGFPGSYMKYINKWLSAQDLLKLMEGKKDRRVLMTEAICYVDEDHEEVFEKQFDGVVLDKPKGPGVANLQISSLTHDGMSIGEHLAAGNFPIPGNPIWDDFARWYKTL